MTTHHIAAADRAAFEQRIADLGNDTPIAVAMCDLEAFGALNDRYGREGGNAVLASWERTLRGSLPGGSIVARLGGDEFAAALPDTTAETALILLEEIRNHFSSRPAADSVPDHVGVRIGVASRPPHAEEPADLLRAADAALHRAKREGGNRVAIYVEEKMVLKSNYYTKPALARLAKLSDRTGRTEASLLREALDDLLLRYNAAG